MKIAFLNTYGNGSTGKIVDLLKKIASENGFESKSFYSREYCATPETSVRLFSKFGFYKDALFTRLFDNHGLNSRRNTRRLISELEKYEPDIVHIHNLHGYWINYKILFKYLKKEKIKVVLTLHDCWTFTGHCTHFDFVKCEKWKSECHHCVQKKIYPKAFMFDNSKKNYHSKEKSFTSLDYEQMIIVTPSEWLKSKVEQSFLKKYRCEVINNGVDLDIFKYSNSDIREKYSIFDKKIVLSVASYWDERKGLKYFFDCARKKPDWYFVYIGKEKSQNQTNLANVIHIERTESQLVLAKWYSTANVFFNPTLEDTYPTTNIESIACGTPVVTFNTGGSPEIVKKSKHGIIVNDYHDSVDKLEEAISSLEKKKVEKSIIDSKLLYKKYIFIYEKLINGD